MSEVKLPNDWTYIRLADICKTSSGGTPLRKTSKYYKGSIPWVKSGELNYNTIFDTEEKITEEAIKDSSAKILPKGTLLIAMYGATVGRLAFLGVEAATNQAICSIETQKNLSNKYLYHFLFFHKNKLLNLRKGGAQPNISQKVVGDIIFPLPPKSEQDRIIEKLEELFSELDAGIESLKMTLDLLKVYRQSVLKYAFEGRLTNPNLKLGELPEGWKIVKLGEIIEPSKDKYEPLNNKKLKFVGLEHIEKDTGEISGFTSSGEVRSTKSIFNKGDLLYGKLRPYLNKVAVTEFDGICSTDILVFKLQNNLSNSFLKYRFLQRDFVNYAQKNVNGVHHPRVNFKTLAEFTIWLPEYSEQNLIVSEIEERLSECEVMEREAKKALQQSESLRQSILKAAFEGKLITDDHEVIEH